MKSTTLSFVLASTVALAQAQSSVNYAAISSQIASMTSRLGITGSWSFPSSVPDLGTILPSPPSGMAAALVTGIPVSVYADLINPTSRSSLAADFKNGNTPSWYLALPSAAQSYIEQVALQASSANPSYAELTYSPTSDYTLGTNVVEPSTAPQTQDPAITSTPTSKADAAISTSTDNGIATAFGTTSGGAKASSTTKKGAASMQTAGLTGALLGGVLAAIVAL